jgi:RNA polymerase sigma factor (sigma-70 family)
MPMQHLLRLVARADDAATTDGALLEGFLSRTDESAFEALLRRHGPMVLRVCRRLLNNAHDAEDAFQATFLVLVCKAASLRQRPTIGPWLYGVAYHTALKARSMAARRQHRERRAAEMFPRDEAAAPARDELINMLDHEVQRLPENYRLPVVLCDLEGQPHKRVAELLGWPEGTVSGRLTRARALLAKRLARHGLVLGVGIGVEIAVPPALLKSTAWAAAALASGPGAAPEVLPARVAALTEGVLHTMTMSKIKIVTVVLLALGSLGLGAGWVSRSALAQRELPAARAEAHAVPENGKPANPSKAAIEAQVKIAEAQVEVARAQVEVAMAQVAEAEAFVEAAKNEVETKELDLKRKIELKRTNAVAEEIVQQAQSAWSKAKNELLGKQAAVRTAKARVRVAEAEVKVAEAHVAAAKAQP